MDVKIIHAWAVHGDSGSVQNTGNGPIIGYCETELDADLHSQGKGSWGGKGAVSKVKMLVLQNGVDSKMYALAQPFPVKFHTLEVHLVQKRDDALLRAETLARLTAEQRRVLGLF